MLLHGKTNKQKKPINKWKGYLLNGRKYLQTIYLTSGYSLKYLRTHTTQKQKQVIQLEHGQKNWRDVFPKKTQSWQARDKMLQYRWSSGKCRLKPQCSISLMPVRMAVIKETTNNKCWRACGGKQTLLTVGGKVDWCSRDGEQYRRSSKN